MLNFWCGFDLSLYLEALNLASGLFALPMVGRDSRLPSFEGDQVNDWSTLFLTVSFCSPFNLRSLA